MVKSINRPKLLLKCQPSSYFSRSFKILGSKTGDIELKFNFFGESGKIILNGDQYSVIKTGILSGRWELIKDGVLIGSATSSRLINTYEFQFNGLDFTLQVVSFGARHYNFCIEGEIEGTVQPESWFNRIANIECSSIVSEFALAFSFWLIVLQSNGYRK